jgi:hypothetical protein
MDFTIVNSTDGLLHVHMRGCADIKRHEMKQANGVFDAEGDNADEFIAQYIRESDVDLDQDHFRVFPCARM